MKIALVYDAVYPWVKGGVERRVFEIGRRLARDGNEIHLYGMKFWDGPAIRNLEGMVLHGICRPFNLYHGGRRSITQGLLFGIALFPALFHGRYDLVDCEEFPYFSCIAAWLAGLASRQPLVITWHEVWGRYWLRYLGPTGIMGFFIERLVARLTPANVAVSGLTAGRIGKLRGSVPIRVIPNGVDMDEVAGVPPTPGFTDVLFAGRLIPEKHIDLLLRSLSLLQKERPDVRAAVIGDGPERESLIDLAGSLEISETVQFIPFLPEPTDLISRMKGSRVFVLPSTREGFGMVALEAMACGLPVVTIDHPDNAARDLVTSDTGRVVPPAPGAIARAIGECLDLDGGVALRCREAASRFSWERIAAETAEYYASLLPPSARR